MKKSILLWQFGGYVFTVFIGTLLHFLYGWTGNSLGVAPFSAVNESTWEHMKILFFPALLFAVMQSCFWRKNYENFWCIKAVGILTATVLVPVLFYTYNGVFGASPDWVNIAIFFLAAAAGFLWEAKLLKKGSRPCKRAKAAVWILIAVAFLFVLFTFFPPQLPLFQDPLTKSYGLR